MAILTRSSLPGSEPAQAVVQTKDNVVLRKGSQVRASELTSQGIQVYDPGFASTQACKSSITFLNGSKGILRYRGYDIDELVTNATYPEIMMLLLYGELPTKQDLIEFQTDLETFARLPVTVINVIQAFPPHSHPMSILGAACAAMSAAYPDLNPSLQTTNVYNNTKASQKAILVALSTFPVICAIVYRHTAGLYPCFQEDMLQPLDIQHLSSSHTRDETNNNKGLFYAKRFLAMVNGQSSVSPNPNHKDTIIARALDTLLTLHADHELNCSTSTMRQLSSSGVDIFTCLGGAVGALYGPLHGGAAEAVLKMLGRIQSVDAVPAFLQRVKNRDEKLMGFGHRVYKTYDPRAKIARQMAYDVIAAVGDSEPLIQVAAALEQAALADEYFVERKLYPNIDFYTGLIYKAVGFPTEYFSVLFALGRSAGWIAHWLEFLHDKDRRIARPQQHYVGKDQRAFIPTEKRTSVRQGAAQRPSRPAHRIAKL